jgi:hypothetical protein
MNGDQRGTRHREAAQAAAVRAREAHDRLVEIERRLRDLRRSAPGAAGDPAHVYGAEREVTRSVARWAESSRRAQQAREATIAAYESAARAHDQAAHVHDRAAAAGVGDAEDHRRLSARHREAAAADRAAQRAS